MAIEAGIVAGTAMGILFVPETRKKFVEILKKSLINKCRREKLEMIKGKLEKHKTKLEMHIQKINSKLNEFETNS